MANRHLCRSIAMQSLFERDFNFLGDAQVNAVVERNIEEFAPGIEDANFAKDLVKGVLKRQEKLDKIIERAAPEWPIGQIAFVDRNILRIGLYELIFGNKNEVPPKVAINESIELAKNFGGDSSGRFVNGVLGTVYREMYPNSAEEVEKILEEKLAGAVVYKKEGDKILFAFVHDVFGYWTLSKGRIEAGEEAREGARRELKEEIGVNVKIEGDLGSNEYIASDPQKGKVKKIVNYFLASTKDKELKLKETGGLDGARWFNVEEIADLKMYDDIRSIIAKAIRILQDKLK
ncbi:transcription antitermination factor NusB [Patescibacteria group bacterium]|nr:transcription antitermination factor NusB [Patescibacteria group bacterium]MBU4353295.1 transcription antitermination factor NusB [Patescibacteria group bacterium]MBU4477350.1 transcription antitermination factor NusB [Patescibacteria group bacterium]MCG2699240.1 transcription antitermination factor NusB [Candidatus Parcubacteria bacterium]